MTPVSVHPPPVIAIPKLPSSFGGLDTETSAMNVGHHYICTTPNRHNTSWASKIVDFDPSKETANPHQERAVLRFQKNSLFLSEGSPTQAV